MGIGWSELTMRLEQIERLVIRHTNGKGWPPQQSTTGEGHVSDIGHCLEPTRFPGNTLGRYFGHHMGWRDAVT